VNDNYNHTDTGCELHPACLSCPLPRCKYDDPKYQKASSRQVKKVSQ
jgi:hypothetical protein